MDRSAGPFMLEWLRRSAFQILPLPLERALRAGETVCTWIWRPADSGGVPRSQGGEETPRGGALLESYAARILLKTTNSDGRFFTG